jgi:hypothetical protein
VQKNNTKTHQKYQEEEQKRAARVSDRQANGEASTHCNLEFFVHLAHFALKLLLFIALSTVVAALLRFLARTTDNG